MLTKTQIKDSNVTCEGVPLAGMTSSGLKQLIVKTDDVPLVEIRLLET